MRKLIAFAAVLICSHAFAGDGVLSLRWSATVPAASHGYGVTLNSKAPNSVPFSVHINLFDPPTSKPFLAGGNIYDRPQREVSLSLGTRQLFNRLSPVELKASDRPIKLSLFVHNQTGGADVDFSADGTAVYAHQFVPLLHVEADAQPNFDGDAQVSAISRTVTGDFTPPVLAGVAFAMSNELNDKSHHTIERMVDFPANVDAVGRVICLLRLDETPAGLDPWDRLAHVYVFDDTGRRFELLRYITPYRKAWQWTSDVTDLLPLLHGRRKLQVHCETYAQGWLVNLQFNFFNGPIEHRPFAVLPVWDTTLIIGQAKRPIEKQLPPTSLDVQNAKLVKLRTLVTGHGMSPNSDNAGEFIPLWRKLWVNDVAHQNLLWTTDNYLNPCSPQHGTWKYDRAGWGPGTVVEPWTVDVAGASSPLNVRYEIQPYENKTPKADFPAQQSVNVQAILCE